MEQWHYSQETGKQDIFQHHCIHIRTTRVQKLSNFMRKKAHANEQVLDQQSQSWIPIDPSCCYSYFLSEFILPFYHLLFVSSILIFSQSEQDVLFWLWVFGEPEIQGPDPGWRLSSYSCCNTNIKLPETCSEV